MSPNRHTYKKEYAYVLQSIAEGDLESAKALKASGSGRIQNVGFLAQQAIEKSLKAVLCFFGRPILHTHNLEALIATMPEDERPPNDHQIKSMTRFATTLRYDEGFEALTSEDLEYAVGLAEQTLAWSRGRIGRP